MKDFSNHISAEKISLGNNISLGENTFIKALNIVIGNNVKIESDVIIEAGNLNISDNAVIKSGNRFNSKNIVLGYKSVIEKDSEFKAINGKADLIKTGDYSFIGKDQTILVPEFTIGDYTSIHKNCLINGYKSCKLGHNCWVGQDSILNSTELLIIGNNVRIGTQSQIWTHVASGELLEGCILFGANPVTIEDNVWIVGGAVISPNLTIKNGSIIMVGSILTKNTEPRRCYAGVPANDVTDKIKVYKEVSSEDKFNMMKSFITEFNKTTANKFKDNIQLAVDLNSVNIPNSNEAIVIIGHGEVAELGDKISVFSLEKKNYIKKKTLIEETFIRFNLGYRARFIPIEN